MVVVNMIVNDMISFKMLKKQQEEEEEIRRQEKIKV
jgi:hypothetical protein